MGMRAKLPIIQHCVYLVLALVHDLRSLSYFQPLGTFTYKKATEAPAKLFIYWITGRRYSE